MFRKFVPYWIYTSQQLVSSNHCHSSFYQGQKCYIWRAVIFHIWRAVFSHFYSSSDLRFVLCQDAGLCCGTLYRWNSKRKSQGI
jgi:hypothetical protein